MIIPASSRKYVPKSRTDLTGGKVETGRLLRLQNSSKKVISCLTFWFTKLTFYPIDKDHHQKKDGGNSNSTLLSSFIKRRNEELDTEIKKYNLKLGFAEASEDNSQLLQRSQRHTSIKIEGHSNPNPNSGGDKTNRFFAEEKTDNHANDSVLIFLAKIRLSNY